MDIIQVIIFTMTASSIWFVSRKEKWMRWGYIIGLLVQPLWLYTSYVSEQWGIFSLCFFYIYSWSMGIYNYWVRKK